MNEWLFHCYESHLCTTNINLSESESEASLIVTQFSLVIALDSAVVIDSSICIL
jgi:hypothetical protein